MRAFLIAAALSFTCAAPTLAQTQPDDETQVEDIVVSRDVETAVRSFVETVGTAPRDRNLARWDGTVCVGVVNMAPRYAQALVDQVSAVGMAVGLEPADPGCRPQILIIADSNGDGLAQWLVDGDPQVFRPDIGNSNLGRDALRHFQSSGEPVRWWHITQTVHTETGDVATGGATLTVRNASRLRSNVREDLRHVIIILDTSRIGTISFASLADYVAMVALAQVDAEAGFEGFDTVLNLWNGGNPTQRMTQWDLDYLRGLYSARADASDPNRQAREITFDVMRDREGQDAEADAAVQEPTPQ